MAWRPWFLMICGGPETRHVARIRLVAQEGAVSRAGRGKRNSAQGAGRLSTVSRGCVYFGQYRRSSVY